MNGRAGTCGLRLGPQLADAIVWNLAIAERCADAALSGDGRSENAVPGAEDAAA